MLLGNWYWDNGKAEFKSGELKVNSIVSTVMFLSAYHFFAIVHIFEGTKLITIDLI